MIRFSGAALLLAATAAPAFTQDDPLAPIPETELEPVDPAPDEPAVVEPGPTPTPSPPVTRPVVVP